MRINNFLHSFAYGIFASTACCLTGCADYSADLEKMQEEKDLTHIVLRISLGNESHSTRATAAKVPAGGENGDGHREGLHHENDIDNLCIFRFKADGSAKAAAAMLGSGQYKQRGIELVNSVDVTPVEKVLYVPNVNFTPSSPGATVNSVTGVWTYDIPLTIKSKEVELFRPASLDQYEYYIVVANMHNIDATTLGELRNKLVTNAWTPGASASPQMADSHCFVMSNEGASRWTGAGDGTEAHPYLFSMDMERVAARLDFVPDGSTEVVTDGLKELKYVANDGGTDVADVYVTHVRPFNVMQHPTYLLKRVASNPYTGTGTRYLADELAYSDAVAASVAPLYVVEPHTAVKDADKSGRDDYELSKWFGDSRYAKAYLHPTTFFTEKYRVHHDVTAKDGFESGLSYDDALNCYYYVLDYANENTMTPAGSLSTTITGYLINADYVPRSVLQLNADGTALEAASYTRGSDFYRYVPMVTEFDESQVRYFTTRAAAEFYAALHPEQAYDITKHPKGKSYYPVFIRHDNSGGSVDVTPMEYGIVRNNIYRLRVSFYGPGYSTLPDIPKLEPLGIKPYLFTRPWYKTVHEEILI